MRAANKKTRAAHLSNNQGPRLISNSGRAQETGRQYRERQRARCHRDEAAARGRTIGETGRESERPKVTAATLCVNQMRIPTVKEELTCEEKEERTKSSRLELREATARKPGVALS